MKLKFLAKIWAFIKSLFKKADKAVEWAVQATQAVKNVMNSGFASQLKTVLKLWLPDAGDAIVDKIYTSTIEWLPKLAQQLAIDVEGDDISTEEGMKSLFQKVTGVDDETWEKFWTMYSQTILQILSDKKVTWAEAGVLVKLFYDVEFKNK